MNRESRCSVTSRPCGQIALASFRAEDKCVVMKYIEALSTFILTSEECFKLKIAGGMPSIALSFTRFN